MRYANVIVDISLEKLDKCFQYRIPSALQGEVKPGMQVIVPFGNRKITGYVTEITETADYPEDKLKEIEALSPKAVPVESQMISLASWLKDTYGGTMNQALKTVLPVKQKVRSRLLSEKESPLPLPSTSSVLLNQEQQAAVDGILQNYPKPALLFGVTGSGKTEVYMELIEEMRKRGKQSILLIPEISLTYQNLKRFHQRFGQRVGVINSRLSSGERYACMEKAKRGEIDLVIGPRSALFAPCPHLGMILVDEEHEGAYFSETTPRYHAIEVALHRGEICGAGVVLGSATPSVSSYQKALAGELNLYRLTRRAKSGSVLPHVQIVDLRRELREGNKTIFSRALAQAMEERLKKREQIMLFLNRRGYANFLSCRSCGTVMKCPHCDVSLTSHQGEKLICHYCGYHIPLPDRCPSCGSPYIAGFGLGTQKVEAMVARYFPQARTLRMDMDTTSRKHDHEKILSSFAGGEADVLIGTQMIVKGHDFPRVTLVGILAADLSLYQTDYRAAERTFQLLTQAAGRAGRANKPGNVIIQTYNPENLTILAAAKQDYEEFYQHEMTYRNLMGYPPAGAMLDVLFTHENEEILDQNTQNIATKIRDSFFDQEIVIIGPTVTGVGKIQDQYRRRLYVKHPSASILRQVRLLIEQEKTVSVQIDLYQ